MAFHVFLFLLVVCLLLSLMLLCRLCWLHRQPSHSKPGAVRTSVQRLLKSRTFLYCHVCRLSCDNSSGVGLAPAPVRPWHEVKSRRSAPKRVKTEGFACPNRKCSYFGITDAHIHALVGDGKHGQAERIQTFRCQACHTTFTCRRNTALYRLTIRHGIAALARRCWATAQQSSHLLAQLEWWRAYYHFVRPHESLRVVPVQPRERGGRLKARRYRQRTPCRQFPRESQWSQGLLQGHVAGR
jgi:hypothetical protein